MIRAEHNPHKRGAAPRCKWLALSEDGARIVGVGDTMREAVIAAAESGVDEPMLVRMPSHWERQLARNIH
jgi:hypothetical protein